MSLDVYLTVEEDGECCSNCGHAKKVTREVFSANITHNLGAMAQEAGVYDALWRPEEMNITLAQQLIAPLQAAIQQMTDEPERFLAFNPPNGWGRYEDFLPWLRDYLQACEDYPDSMVRVWR